MKKGIKHKKWQLATFLLLALATLIIYENMIEKNPEHIIPDAIRKEAEFALSHYPELRNTRIEFKFKKNIKKSIMQAQPSFLSLLRPKKKRSYYIFISENFEIEGQKFATKDIPENVMIGWLGHELGHVMDYRNRSSLNLIWFGIKYYFIDASIKEAERAADSHAVAKNLDGYILDTKNFILNNTNLSEIYKARIRKYYLSPDEIMILVEERDKAKQ
ncbi:hypothetical protein H0I25_00665 [Cellulophaga sp. HaHa_2_95]|uniref:hypothetical protein n=1 Tax=unclassified Cellulophaga TaxID=2634405 RepID=UPI001C4F158E|nr:MULTISPECIES: hypothetical protein [unclassified Cellulophaga]QXP51339.1 hypothetical protein H0I24_14455 [Cellulophaga sp. HaHa_2_1]QXP56335.1 hypothetical protein H0I25_00665 [Cellulophaga sp. HaHa_2_95]